MKTFYITTPLYYVNAAPHIGHSYTTVVADCLARYYRLKDVPVFFLTGTDEHGQKIEQAAAAAGQAPPAFVNGVVERFTSLWKVLGISHDDFIRTTQPRHTQVVQACLTKLRQEGKLQQASYEGWYCTPCETFWSTEQIPHPADREIVFDCPNCQRPLERIREEGWHLPLEGARPWLENFVRTHPTFVQPASRYNELVGLLKEPLPEFLCVTRPRNRVGWGVPVPYSQEHVTYVWFDALINYISVPGYASDERRFASLWPADVHIIGKDILRHHAVYWPIILHALGLPDEQMPRMIFAHGWWKIGEQKMSKSRGNIVDPTVVVREFLKDQPYAADVYRYFLLREVPFGQDGNFSEDAITKRLETDLANDLGNLVHRTLSMIDRYCQGRLPLPGLVGCAVEDVPLRDEAVGLAKQLDARLPVLDFAGALEAVFHLITHANRYIESTAPWQLAKEKDPSRLQTVLAMLAEVIRVVAITLSPFMPSVAEAMWEQLGLRGVPCRWQDAAQWPALTAGQPIGKRSVLFPKVSS